MKKEILVFLICMVSINLIQSQNKVNFKPEIKLLKNTFKAENKNPESVLFIFNVVNCEANYYINLAKNIKKRFKKSNTKVKFNFEINTKLEIEQIPEKKYSKNNFQLICYISTSNLKSWDNHLTEKSKQNYDLNLRFEKNKSKEKEEKIELNINSYHTIITQNKNASKLIFKLLTE